MTNSSDLFPDRPLEQSAVETRLRVIDEQVEQLLEAIGSDEQFREPRRHLREIRTECLSVRHHFELALERARAEDGTDIPAVVSRGNGSRTIMGPDPVAFERVVHSSSDTDDE